MIQSDCLCTNLRHAALASTRIYDAALAPSGLKVTMYRLLRRIAETPEITITRLADLVGLDRSTLGRNIALLRRAGYLTAEHGQDARTRGLTLTDHGRRSLAEAGPLWEAAQDEMRTRLGSDADRLLDLLARIGTEGGGHDERHG